jgi:hypothetical protein
VPRQNSVLKLICRELFDTCRTFLNRVTLLVSDHVGDFGYLNQSCCPRIPSLPGADDSG